MVRQLVDEKLDGVCRREGIEVSVHLAQSHETSVMELRTARLRTSTGNVDRHDGVRVLRELE